MADYTWPSSLPQEPFADGDVTYTPADNFIRPSMEVGSAKSRMRFTAVPETVPVTLHLSMSSVATLRAFAKTVGTKAFNWIDFTTLQAATYCFTTGITRRFIGVDELTGEYWYEATFTLELNP